jgi:hypothetical protein
VSKESAARPPIGIRISAALITMDQNEPMVLTLGAPSGGRSPLTGDGASLLRLPAGLLQPREHGNLDAALRALVSAQTGFELGYSEQLYTFGEQGRATGPSLLPLESDGAADRKQSSDDQQDMVSIGYLALLAATAVATQGGHWVSCYAVLPWEDWRAGKPAVLADLIEPQLEEWAFRPSRLLPEAQAEGYSLSRRGRIDLAFGLNGAAWDEERALERHEILYEAGLLCEVRRDSRLAGQSAEASPSRDPLTLAEPMRLPNLPLGMPLAYDHRRMLAMALGRLRAKIKYRPIVFELMDETFTLFELQRTVEAILGTPLHKQNFRRLVETTGLVEEVGDIRAKTGGRPAKLFRFRPHVVLERSAPGVRIKSMRT